MSKQFWLELWESNEIPFHKASVHPALPRYESRLHLEGARVLVPLAGKSLDMLWLRAQGAYVVGVELSEIACRQFFEENNLDYRVETKGDYVSYCSDGLCLYQGDFFSFREEMDFDYAYDRASLIALPPKLRFDYARQLAKLVRPQGQKFLISLEYSSADFDGPPFSVSADEIATLYQGDFDIHCYHREPNDKVPEAIRANCFETVYALRRR